jgi:hypothetical protein
MARFVGLLYPGVLLLPPQWAGMRHSDIGNMGLPSIVTLSPHVREQQCRRYRDIVSPQYNYPAAFLDMLIFDNPSARREH